MKGFFLILFVLIFLIFIRSKEDYVNFPSVNDAVRTWESGDYFDNLNTKDKIARNIPTNYNSKQIIALYKTKLLPISKEEKEIIKKKLERLRKYNFLNSVPWKIVKFSGIENNYPHTHGDIIFLPPDFFDPSTDESSTFLHEKVHVLQRLYPKEFSDLFKKWGFYPISKQQYHNNTRSNPDTNNSFWAWKDHSDLVALYKKNPKNIADVDYKTIKNNRVYDINQDYYNYFGLYHNHYHVNEISAELLAQYIMNRNKKTNATIILDNWYINNLKHK